MKYFLLFTLFLGLCYYKSSAQEITIDKINNEDTASLLNSLRGIEEFYSDGAVIRLIESGYITTEQVAGLRGDIIVHKLFIYVQLLTEDERTSMESYWVDGNFFNPRGYKFDSETRRLSFQHGVDQHQEFVSLKISSTGLTVN